MSPNISPIPRAGGLLAAVRPRSVDEGIELVEDSVAAAAPVDDQSLKEHPACKRSRYVFNVHGLPQAVNIDLTRDMSDRNMYQAGMRTTKALISYVFGDASPKDPALALIGTASSSAAPTVGSDARLVSLADYHDPTCSLRILSLEEQFCLHTSTGVLKLPAPSRNLGLVVPNPPTQ